VRRLAPPLRQPRSRWLPLSMPLRRGRRLRLDLDWPCGQNPGRKPEGRQHASTREAMSLGEQDSTCRASTSLCRAGYAASGTARMATRRDDSAGVASNGPGSREASGVPFGSSPGPCFPLGLLRPAHRLPFGPNRQRKGEPNGLHLQARARGRDARRPAEARHRRIELERRRHDSILRVIDTRPAQAPDEDPVLVVETA
jgi:hypothetical protein